MMNADFKERAKEIEELVINNNLDYATLRFMDFATDFNHNKEDLIYAKEVRARYSELREKERFGTLERNIIKTEQTQLRTTILSYVTDISESFDRSRQNEEKDIFNSKNNLASPASSKPPLYNGNKIDKTDTFNTNIDLDLTKYEIEKKAYFQKQKATIFNSNFVFEGKEICKNYKNRSTKFNLSSIDINLILGEITAIVGENGNGKTTLLRIVAGELAASQGEVSYPSLTSSGDTDWYSIKKQIAYVPQDLPKWPGLLAENLHFAASIHGITGKDNDHEVDWIIYRLGLEQYKKAKWNEISGGYKRRFALAMALICKPKLLILDEPMANLDINTQMRFLQDLRDLANSCKYPIAVVISSQNLYDIERIADQIIFLKNGQAAYNGLIKDIGKDRNFNSYEIACDSSGNIRDLLQNVCCTKIEEVGSNFIIHTSLDITNLDLIKVLIENKVSLKYFRDISKSTRTLFKEKL